MIRVKLYGAGGYGGIGMIELLLKHPEAKIVSLIGNSENGKHIWEIWPHLRGYLDMKITDAAAPEAQVEADVAICSTPDGVGQAVAPVEVKAGRRVIDYSGDFRFNTAEMYAAYATRIKREPKHLCPELLPQSAYGLTELHRDEIKNAKVVGNPGCFAISCIMGWAPAVQAKLVELPNLICDCKTAISGAGKKPNLQFHYPERYDNMNAYKLLGHQHVIEIERELSGLAGRQINVTFTPQVVPMARGIMSTLYGRLVQGATQAKVFEAYKSFYAGEKFVRVLGDKESTGTCEVRGSNYINIQVACDERAGTFRVISHIDNLMKGQASSAVQNLNAMFGLNEAAGLDFPGTHP